MTIQEMIDTVDSLNTTCLYDLPNFTFDEVCNNFVNVKFPDVDDKTTLLEYYKDGGGKDALTSDMNNVKGNFNKAARTIGALQSCLHPEEKSEDGEIENVIVMFGTKKTLNAMAEEISLCLTNGINASISIAYELPDKIVEIVSVIDELKEEIKNADLDIFSFLDEIRKQGNENSKAIQDIKDNGVTPPGGSGLTESDWEKIKDQIQAGIDKAVGSDSDIHKQIDDLNKEKEGLADEVENLKKEVDNMAKDTTAVKLETYDTYIEGTVAHLGINPDGTINYDKTHLVLTSDEAYLNASKLVMDEDGNVTNFNKTGLVLTSDEAYLAAQKLQYDENGNVTNFDKSGLVLTTDEAYLAAQKLQYDENGNVTNFDKSGLVLTTDEAYLTAQKIKMDSDGNITNICTAGLVLTNDGENGFSTLFSQAVDNDHNIVKQADISTFVTKDEDGYLQSGVLIRGDSIRLEGYISANNGFSIDTNGSMTATSGKIGGFEIGSSYIGTKQTDDDPYSSLQQTVYLDNSEIIFNAPGRQAIVGTPNFYGYEMLARFIDNKQEPLGDKTAIGITVKNALGHNTAISLGGGHISGLALRIESFGVGSTSSIDRTTLSKNISFAANVVEVTTQYTQTTKNEVKTSDVYLTLPNMHVHDDGHIIFIKRILNGGSTVRLYPGTFFEPDKNGVILNAVTSSSFYNVGYINKYNGVFVQEDTYLHSEYINIRSWAGYTVVYYIWFKGDYGIAFYNSSMGYIGGADAGLYSDGSSKAVTIPTSAYYMRVCRYNTTEASNGFKVMSTEGTTIADGNSCILNGAINHSNGTEYAGHACTDFVSIRSYANKVLSATMYVTGAAGIAFYDSDKNFIGGYNSSTTEGEVVKFRVPQNAYYGKFSIRNEHVTKSKWELRNTEEWGEIANNSIIIRDRSTFETNYSTLGSENDAMTLIFDASLVYTTNGVTYKGAWLEFKNPRDW